MKPGLLTVIPFLGDRFVLGIPLVNPPLPLGIGLFFCAALCKNRWLRLSVFTTNCMCFTQAIWVWWAVRELHHSSTAWHLCSKAYRAHFQILLPRWIRKVCKCQTKTIPDNAIRSCFFVFHAGDDCWPWHGRILDVSTTLQWDDSMVDCLRHAFTA